MTDSINTYNEYASISAFFKSQAIDFLDSDAAVYLEGEEDVYFWQNVLKHTSPDQNYEFYYNSNLDAIDEDQYSSGITECINLFPHTDKEFIVCVDSDYLLTPLHFHTKASISINLKPWVKHYACSRFIKNICPRQKTLY